MNIENMQKAIAVMERADRLYMPFYQNAGSTLTRKYAETETELHACGNTACFAGYLAVSPEFQADGGSAIEGAPEIQSSKTDRNGKHLHFRGAMAIADWLDIPTCYAVALVHGGLSGLAPVDQISPVYGRPFNRVKARDVIDELRLLMAQKEDACFDPRVDYTDLEEDSWRQWRRTMLPRPLISATTTLSPLADTPL